MLRRCTFCEHYNIHAVYYPELYNLPISTICVKLQWPRMYEEGELEDKELWGFMKDCSLYKRSPTLNNQLSTECDKWEEDYDNSRRAGASKPEHSDKIEQAQGCNDQEQRSGRIDNKASTEGKGSSMATGHGAPRITQEKRGPVKGVHGSVEADQLRLPCSETDS